MVQCVVVFSYFGICLFVILRTVTSFSDSFALFSECVGCSLVWLSVRISLLLVMLFVMLMCTCYG